MIGWDHSLDPEVDAGTIGWNTSAPDEPEEKPKDEPIFHWGGTNVYKNTVRAPFIVDCNPPAHSALSQKIGDRPRPKFYQTYETEKQAESDAISLAQTLTDTRTDVEKERKEGEESGKNAVAWTSELDVLLLETVPAHDFDFKAAASAVIAHLKSTQPTLEWHLTAQEARLRFGEVTERGEEETTAVKWTPALDERLDELVIETSFDFGAVAAALEGAGNSPMGLSAEAVRLRYAELSS
jgi:hypothetical protein